MNKIAKDMVVTVTYRIEGQQGEILERIDLPVRYLHGSSSDGIVPKVENALEGMVAGAEISVTLSPEEGFGEWDRGLTFTDKIENVPPQYRKIGAATEFSNADGEILKMTVTHLDNGTVTLDGNHPFAGKWITFHLKVLEVRKASAAEKQYGVVRNTDDITH